MAEGAPWAWVVASMLAVGFVVTAVTWGWMYWTDWVRNTDERAQL